MKRKHLLCIALALIITTLSFTSCAGGASGSSSAVSSSTPSSNAPASSEQQEQETVNTYPLVDTPVTMSMFMLIRDNAGDMNDHKFFKDMEALTNIKWELNCVTVTSNVEKRNLLLVSGDYQDVFFKGGITPLEEVKFGGEVFIPLEKLIEENMPNLTALMNENSKIKANITTPNGSIYALPHVSSPGPQLPLFINVEWMNKLGLKEAETIEEFYELLKAFKEKDPNGNGKSDEIPLTFFDPDLIFRFIPFFGMPVDFGRLVGVVDDKVLFAPYEDAYKQTLIFLNRLYSEGLLDQSAFVQDLNQQNAKGQDTEPLLGAFFNAGAFLTVGADRDASYDSMTPVKAANGKQIWISGTGMDRGTFAVTDKCKYPELAVRWVDYFYSDEGGMYAWMGTENEQYKFNADGTWSWIYTDAMPTQLEVRQNGTIQGTAAHPGKIPANWKKLDDPLEMAVNARRDKLTPYLTLPYPSVYMPDEDQKIINTKDADIKPYVREYGVKCITGEQKVEDTWNEYIATLEKMGIKELIELYQKNYDIYKSNS